jgi:hypothetical protein
VDDVVACCLSVFAGGLYRRTKPRPGGDPQGLLAWVAPQTTRLIVPASSVQFGFASGYNVMVNNKRVRGSHRQSRNQSRQPSSPVIGRQPRRPRNKNRPARNDLLAVARAQEVENILAQIDADAALEREASEERAVVLYEAPAGSAPAVDNPDVDIPVAPGRPDDPTPVADEIACLERGYRTLPLQSLDVSLDSFKDAIHNFWLGRARNKDNIASCLKMFPVWANRYKVSMRLHEDVLLDYMYYVYVRQSNMGHYGVERCGSEYAGLLGWKKYLTDKWLNVKSRFTYVPEIERSHHATSWEDGLKYRVTQGVAASSYSTSFEDCCSGYTESDVDSTKMHPSAKISLPFWWNRTCRPRSRTTLLSVYGRHPIIPRSCYHNELKAVCTRQLKATPSPKHGTWKGAMSLFIRTLQGDILPELGFDFEAWVRRYAAPRAEVLRREKRIRDYYDDGNANQMTKAFVKVETLLKHPTDFKPRHISGKADSFLVATSEYYAFDKATNNHLFSPANKMVCASGMTAEQVGMWYAEQLSRGYSYIVENDFSTYDASQSVEAGDAYTFWLNQMLPQNPELVKALDIRHNSGYTPSGIKYSREGSMDSGRIDTTKRNTVLNMAATVWVYRFYGFDVEGIFLGDDSVIFLRAAEPLEFFPVDAALRYSYLGFECTPIVRDDPWTVEFCSQRFWQVSPVEWVLGPKLGRWLAKTFVTKNDYGCTEDKNNHVRGVCLGFKNQMHLPVVYHICTWLLGHLGQGPARVSTVHEWQIVAETQHEPSAILVAQFESLYATTLMELENVELPVYSAGCVLDHHLWQRLVDVDTKYAYVTEPNWR